MPSTAIASHRGGAFLWPENSLLAFREAARLPAEQIELDIHASADGEPVVIHDATLERTTDGQGRVVAHPWSALRALRLRGAGTEGIPHLADAARVIGAAGQFIRLEVKADAEGRPYPGLVARAAATLDGAGLRGRAVLMSFEPATVAEAAQLQGFAGLVWLAPPRLLRGMRAADAAALCRACGAGELGVHEGQADAGLRDTLRAAGLGLSVWAANHVPTIRRALGLGVEVLATDDPPLALQLRADLG